MYLEENKTRKWGDSSNIIMQSAAKTNQIQQLNPEIHSENQRKINTQPVWLRTFNNQTSIHGGYHDRNFVFSEVKDHWNFDGTVKY